MAIETPTINAEPRERLGTRYSQRLRKSGRLPGVIYGHKANPVAISVDEKETLAVLKRGAHVINVALEGGQPETCLIKDLQFGYLGDNVIHVDFARVDLNEEVEVNVHLRFVGVPESAKKPGSILTHPMTQLPVVCKVSEIPGEIKIDLSKMEDLFTVGEVPLPPGVRTKLAPHIIVAQVTFVAEEVVATPEAAEVTAAVPTEPEVITEKKPEAEAPADEKEKK
ncbi:MAG: 50S ribosomal protein L25 [Phycisphaerales bacterium]|nr:50S ribosomal protein L25 [Phycisphaerales bacterium]MCI0630881.1 50S ribosomal protein L25 [Phycisphaerales bacterium]MCI0676176.1 50S ribosomal protein L25 [Phycisphaerales bacterium]